MGLGALALLFPVTVLGGLLSGLTGLAGGAFILGALLFFYPAPEALALHGAIQLLSNGTRVAVWWREVRWDIVWRYSLLLLPGAWVGGLWLPHLNLHLMEALLGAMILLATWGKLPKHLKVAAFDREGFVKLGLVSGFFSMLAGVVGPLLNPFFDKVGIKRERMVSTKSACQLALHTARVGAYTGAAGIDYGEHGSALALMAVAVLIGLFLARPIGKRVSDRQLDLLIKGLLTLIGMKGLLSGLAGYLT